MSKQDKFLVEAAIALYNAGQHGAVPFEGSDEDFANFCIQTVTRFFADLGCEPDDTQAVAVEVYTELYLDTSKVR